MTKPMGVSDSKLDRQALLLFFGLTACFAAIAYIPMVKSGSLQALGGLPLLLLMWSPGFAGLITARLMFRSVRPLGFGSDSVWPCAFFHASHNLIFLHLFDPMKLRTASSTWLVGEQGLLLALVIAPLGVYGLLANQKLRPS